MAKKYLTLNIGASTVELAEYEAGAKGALTLVKYGTAKLAAPLDGGNAETILSPALLEIVREQGIKPGPVAVAIPGQMVFPRLAAIPLAGGDEKFEQMVRYEVEQNIPFPIDEMVCDRQIVGETAAGDKSVLIVAAKVDQVEALTGAVAAAGFIPELVDVAPLALANVLRAAHPDEGCTVVLDIGSKTTSLAIMEEGRLYNRSIPVAGQAITKEIASALGWDLEQAEQAKLEGGYVSMGGVTEDEDEATDRISKVCRAVLTRLTAEISRSINFYRSQQGGGVPTKLYLTGGTALLPQIDTFFAESLGIEVEFLNPLEAIGVGPRVDAAALEADAAILAATAGLALHASGQSAYSINLLPPSLVAAAAEKAKIPFLVGAGVALVVALLLVTFSVNRQAAEIGARGEEISAETGSLSAVARRVADAAKALGAAETEAVALQRLLDSRSLALRRMAVICKAVESRPGMWIDRLNESGVTVRYWSDRVKESGGSTVAESVAGAIGRGDTNLIDRASVKITSMSEIGKDAQVKQFTVEFKGK